MSVCELCGMEVVTVYECSNCGAQFCDECGDIKRKLCHDCLGWGESDSDDAKYKEWEDEDWDDEPN
jgi:predicted nucleic acid binding AN1-type Zn finger protein